MFTNIAEREAVGTAGKETEVASLVSCSSVPIRNTPLPDSDSILLHFLVALNNFLAILAMEGNGFSSLKDPSKSPSHPRPTLVGSRSTPATWGYASFSNVAGFFDLSLGGSSLSSINSLYATLPSSSSSTRLSDVMGTEACFNQKEEIMIVDAEKYVAFGNSTKKKGLFPPPISCLKLFNKGMPYRYLSYKEENDSFELEEIQILQGDILRANRSGGRSRLTFVVSDDESSDVEEETIGTAE